MRTLTWKINILVQLKQEMQLRKPIFAPTSIIIITTYTHICRFLYSFSSLHYSLFIHVLCRNVFLVVSASSFYFYFTFSILFAYVFLPSFMKSVVFVCEFVMLQSAVFSSVQSFFSQSLSVLLCKYTHSHILKSFSPFERRHIHTHTFSPFVHTSLAQYSNNDNKRLKY